MNSRGYEQYRQAWTYHTSWYNETFLDCIFCQFGGRTEPQLFHNLMFVESHRLD